MRLLILSATFLISGLLVGQEDSLRHKALEEVDVLVRTTENTTSSPGTTLFRRDIEELAPLDVGELLQKMPGVTVKSYGGLGGLKTVSFRGLGAHHTNISVDGFPLLNSQTGQVNVAQVQTEHIESISTTDSRGSEMLLPVSSQVAGATVLIKTTMLSYTTDTFKMRSSFSYGSFDQYDANGIMKYSRKRTFVSGYGKARTSAGNYSYQLNNGSNTSMETRSNNDYRDVYMGFATGFELKNRTTIRLAYEGKSIDQELPGAVILYNQTADEQLSTEDHSLKMDFIRPINSHRIRVFAIGSRNKMLYYDPTYLNSEGFLKNAYENKSLTGGMLYHSPNLRGFRIHAGIEHAFSTLDVTGQFNDRPERFHNYALAGLRWQKGFYAVHTKVSGQYISDQTLQHDSREFIKVNPQISIERANSNARMTRIKLEYRSSFRPPTFSELYYGGIGNSDLEPETAQQLSVNTQIQPLKKYTAWYVELSAYASLVENKILAIPTKNLFVWSIQNIGKSGGAGLDVIQSWKALMGQSSVLHIGMNYSLQLMVDLSDSEGPTYGHQIAYIPLHTANADLGIEYRQINLRISNYFVSERYVLNENIPANLEGGFVTTDLMLSWAKKVGQKGRLTVQGTVKNLLDQQYAYIRSFVMPGRNYLITLKYAFN